MIETHASLLRHALVELFLRLHHAHEGVAAFGARGVSTGGGKFGKAAQDEPEHGDMREHPLFLALEARARGALGVPVPLLAESRREHDLNGGHLITLHFGKHVGKPVERIILHEFVRAQRVAEFLLKLEVVTDHAVALGPHFRRRLQCHLGIAVESGDLFFHDGNKLRLRDNEEQQLPLLHVHLEADTDIACDPEVDGLPEVEVADFPERAIELLHHRDFFFEIFFRALLLVEFRIGPRQHHLHGNELAAFEVRHREANHPLHDRPGEVQRGDEDSVIDGIHPVPLPQIDPDMGVDDRRTESDDDPQERPEEDAEEREHGVLSILSQK